MMRFASVLVAGLMLASPSFGQSVGSCARGMSMGPNTPFVLFDLGSATLRPEAKPVITEAAAKAKAQQAVDFCIVGQTDKLGDKALNEKLAAARARSVAAELIKHGVPAAKIIIASNPEAFGNVNFGSMNASEKDRRVSIMWK